VVRALSHAVWCSAMPVFACGSAKYSWSGKAKTAIHSRGHLVRLPHVGQVSWAPTVSWVPTYKDGKTRKSF
jgi:hypothetical protein